MPQAAVAMYSDHVRAFLDLPEDRLVVCAVGLGWADEEHAVNAFRTERADLDEAVAVVDRARRDEVGTWRSG